METGKTSKYLKYAIGEIILVVIGILIALSINNWNENRKQVIIEQEILNSLKFELLEVKKTLSNIRRFHESSSKIIIDSIKKGMNEFKESDIAYIFSYTPNKINTSVLEDILGLDRDLKSTSIEFIRDLRNLKQILDGINKDNEYIDDFWKSDVTPFFIKSGIGYSSIRPENTKISLSSLKAIGYDKYQLLALIGLFNTLESSWINSQLSGEQKIDKTLDMLEKELNNF